MDHLGHALARKLSDLQAAGSVHEARFAAFAKPLQQSRSQPPATHLPASHPRSSNTSCLAMDLPLQPSEEDFPPGVDETVTALTGSMESHTITPGPDKRPNFPLPRELRDRIYDFLLDGACVEEAPYRHRTDLHSTDGSTAHQQEVRSISFAHTYKFHTNILAVNKQIAGEAGKTLYKANNRFVLVEHLWPGLKVGALMFTLHSYDVSILLDHQATVLPKEIHLTFSIHHHQHSDHHTSGKPPHPKRQFVMLWRDFPRFRSMLQWMFFQFESPMDVVTQIPGAVTGITSPAPRHFRTKIVFDSLKDMDDHQMQNLNASLAVFEGLIIPGQEVIVTSPVSNAAMLDFARKSLRNMGRREVDLHVAIWHAVDTARSLKGHADELTLSGQYEVARWRYGSILGALQSREHQGLGRLMFLEHLPTIMVDGKAANALAALLLLTLDVAVTVARLHLYHANFNAFAHSMASMLRIVNLLDGLRDCEHLSPDFKAREYERFHPSLYMVCLLPVVNGGGSDFDDEDGEEDEGQNLVNMVKYLKIMTSEYPGDLSYKQDLDIFEKILDCDTVRSPFPHVDLWRAADHVRSSCALTTLSVGN